MINDLFTHSHVMELSAKKVCELRFEDSFDDATLCGGVT